MVIYVYFACLDLINFRISSALFELSVLGCACTGAGRDSAGCAVSVAGADAVSAGALATGVTLPVAADTPAGRKY